jgi:hypothetical protein
LFVVPQASEFPANPASGLQQNIQMTTAKPIKHYLQFSDLTLDEYDYVLERTRILKKKFKNYETYHRCTTARWR